MAGPVENAMFLRMLGNEWRNMIAKRILAEAEKVGPYLIDTKKGKFPDKGFVNASTKDPVQTVEKILGMTSLPSQTIQNATNAMTSTPPKVAPGQSASNQVDIEGGKAESGYYGSMFPYVNDVPQEIDYPVINPEAASTFERLLAKARGYASTSNYNSESGITSVDKYIQDLETAYSNISKNITNYSLLRGLTSFGDVGSMTPEQRYSMFSKDYTLPTAGAGQQTAGVSQQGVKVSNSSSRQSVNKQGINYSIIGTGPGDKTTKTFETLGNYDPSTGSVSLTYSSYYCTMIDPATNKEIKGYLMADSNGNHYLSDGKKKYTITDPSQVKVTNEKPPKNITQSFNNQEAAKSGVQIGYYGTSNTWIDRGAISYNQPSSVPIGSSLNTGQQTGVNKALAKPLIRKHLSVFASNPSSFSPEQLQSLQKMIKEDGENISSALDEVDINDIAKRMIDLTDIDEIKNANNPKELDEMERLVYMMYGGNKSAIDNLTKEALLNKIYKKIIVLKNKIRNGTVSGEDLPLYYNVLLIYDSL